MVWVGKELKAHPAPTPATGTDTFHYSSLLQAPVSNLASNTARDGAATASLGNLCQRLSTLTGKNFCLRAQSPLCQVKAMILVLSCPYKTLSKAPLQISCSPLYALEAALTFP